MMLVEHQWKHSNWKKITNIREKGLGFEEQKKSLGKLFEKDCVVD